MVNREAERKRLVELVENFFEKEIGASFVKGFLDKFADNILDDGWMRPPSEHVYFIVDKGTKYAMAMSKRTDELPLYKLRDLEKYGYYLSKEEAERHL